MRLPRRVPWASLAELDQVCSWIYADEQDIEAKVLAVNRLAAWRFITGLPHALESAHAILVAIVQDASSQGSTSFLSLRQTYASAIIRFVNGLVDPLQLGAYARSIASIANQLGLPAWLVEIRHAATHEDLPSLEVLRDASRDAMVWLLNNYFLPSLNPSTPPPAKIQLRSILPTLKQYKTLLKTTTRDVSLRSTYQPEVTKIIRDIERWIAEAKVAANVSAGGFQWDISANEEDMVEKESRERWALEQFCDALLERGILVPTAKKKRALATPSFVPQAALISIWSPLLTHMQSLHPSLPSVLVSKIISQILSQEEPVFEGDTISLDTANAKGDVSYDMCLASWANWLVETWGANSDQGDSDEEELTREDIVATLITALGVNKEATARHEQVLKALLKVLCAGFPYLQEAAALLSRPSMSASPNTWTDTDIETMSDRLDKLLASQALDGASSQSNTPSISTSPAPEPSPEEEIHLPPGWRLLSERDGWKPSPMGVFVPCDGRIPMV